MKDTFFYIKKTLGLRGKLLFPDFPFIMGILNITPDSFYKGSRFTVIDQVLAEAEKMIHSGADVLDIGGYSSRPGAADVSPEDEVERTVPVIREIHKRFPDTLISVDTFRSKVATAAVEEGASWVNDISGGMLDEEMINTVAELKVPYIVMHMRGDPRSMKDKAHYHDLVKELGEYFSGRISLLRQRGISDLILDPGIGFAKSIAQNFEILKNLPYFQIFGFPLMIGISRKSLIYRSLKIDPEDALNGTTVLNTIALLNKASILRVHDVKAAKEILELMKLYLP